MSRGIVYIATGEEYIAEAKKSARQARRVMDCSIALISDRQVDCELFDINIIDQDPKYEYYDAVRNLDKSPFDRTIYLDTDIYILDGVSELFDLLDYCDIAAAVDPNEAALRIEKERNFEDRSCGGDCW